MPETIAFADQLRAAGATARMSLEALREHPASVTSSPLGRWFEASWRTRALRRLLIAVPGGAERLAGRCGTRASSLAVDAVFWRATRHAATSAEWRRLTPSSYVVLYYHRLAGELRPGQERLDLAPGCFAAQMRLLGRLGFTALTPEQLRAFHHRLAADLPPRAYVVTADDGFRDCVEPFLAHASVHPQLFVPTAEVGGRSWWAGDSPLAGWEELRRLAAAGVGIGSHSSSHLALDELDDHEVSATLRSSRERLAAEVDGAIPFLAYPHGRRDRRVTRMARASGFELGFTTDPGRNALGTDPLQLRRIGVKAWDSRWSFLFKVLPGELLPARWEERLIRAHLPEYHQRLSRQRQSDA